MTPTTAYINCSVYYNNQLATDRYKLNYFLRSHHRLPYVISHKYNTDIKTAEHNMGPAFQTGGCKFLKGI